MKINVIFTRDKCALELLGCCAKTKAYVQKRGRVNSAY